MSIEENEVNFESLKKLGRASPLWDGELPWPDVLRVRSKFDRLSTAEVVATNTPEQQVRKILQTRLPAGETLPPTKSFELYYLRVIARTAGGKAGKVFVPYPVEFAYLLDVGYAELPTVRVSYKIAGSGDPFFPDFSDYFVATSSSRRDDAIVSPITSGKLIVGFEPTVPDSQAIASLAPFGPAVGFSTNTFLVCVTAFREMAVAAEIQATVNGVRFAEGDFIERLVDMGPWIVSRVV